MLEVLSSLLDWDAQGTPPLWVQLICLRTALPSRSYINDFFCICRPEALAIAHFASCFNPRVALGLPLLLFLLGLQVAWIFWGSILVGLSSGAHTPPGPLVVLRQEVLVPLEPAEVPTISFLALIAVIDPVCELVLLLPSLSRLKSRTCGQMHEKTLIKA